jgi:hypothetical protein
VSRALPTWHQTTSGNAQLGRRTAENIRNNVIAGISFQGNVSVMSTTRRIGFLAFDGLQALDLVGPADAFGSDAFDLELRTRDASASRLTLALNI